MSFSFNNVKIWMVYVSSKERGLTGLIDRAIVGRGSHTPLISKDKDLISVTPQIQKGPM